MELPLTPLEFELLVALAAKPQQVFSREMLLEQVWVHDGESRVKAVLAKSGVKLLGFARFLLGEGIDKAQDADAA